MAHATDPVGPSAVGQGETAVVATASAPYATAREETGDTTNVVSASYVKGAYNDAIAAVNKVNSLKQSKLTNSDTGDEVSSDVIAFVELNDASFVNDGDYNTWYDNIDDHVAGIDNTLMSAGGVITLIKTATDEVQTANNSKRISVVTTWGDDDNPTKLQLTTASN